MNRTAPNENVNLQARMHACGVGLVEGFATWHGRLCNNNNIVSFPRTNDDAHNKKKSNVFRIFSGSHFKCNAQRIRRTREALGPAGGGTRAGLAARRASGSAARGARRTPPRSPSARGSGRRCGASRARGCRLPPCTAGGPPAARSGCGTCSSTVSSQGEKVVEVAARGADRAMRMNVDDSRSRE